MSRKLHHICRLAGATTLLMALGAAGPAKMPAPIGDVGPLGQAVVPAPGKTLVVQNTMYQAAPMPDPDAAGPAGAVSTDAQVVPRFISAPSLFQGDGYAYASSQQATLDRRKAAAAGLGLSVPVDQ